MVTMTTHLHITTEVAPVYMSCRTCHGETTVTLRDGGRERGMWVGERGVWVGERERDVGGREMDVGGRERDGVIERCECSW